MMHRTRRSDGDEGGFTLIELVVVSVLLIVMAGAVTSMAHRGSEAQDFVRRNTKVTNKTQTIVSRIRDDIASSIRLLYNDTEGSSYLNGCDFGTVPAISTSTLPTIKPTGGFGKDTVGNEFTGNCIAFVKQERTDVFDVSDYYDPAKIVRVDIYRLYVYYLHKQSGVSNAHDSDLDLVRWRSVALIDSKQCEALTSAEKQRLYVHLYNGTNPKEPSLTFPVARLLWEQGETFTNAFRIIEQDGSTSSPPAGFKLPEGKQRWNRSLLQRASLGVARNLIGAGKGIARFALMKKDFPHGFETQVIGPASARQVLLHFTLVGNRGQKLRSVIDLMSVAETRDL